MFDVLSCIQPTAEMHIGNYFGAIKTWVALQDRYRCVYGIVDLHAMTVPYDPQELRRNTEEMALVLLACGIDTARTPLFLQSLVPEHSELAWILGCVCGYGELQRMTQFKEKRHQIEDGAGREFVSAGLFTYPILQAADILIYRAQWVPVGKDQEQHLELSRELARRFNDRFGADILREPQPLWSETPKIMSLAEPTKKMSKSAGDKHYVGILDSADTIRKKLRAAVTDSGEGSGPGVANLFDILRACGANDVANPLRDQLERGTLRYSVLKDATSDVLAEYFRPIRERHRELSSRRQEILEAVDDLSASVRNAAQATLRDVRAAAGLRVKTT